MKTMQKASMMPAMPTTHAMQEERDDPKDVLQARQVHAHEGA